MGSTINLNANRIVFLDFVRAIACFMVILVHACEFFFIGDRVFSSDELFWANLIDSALRSAVPLFVMVSSYLLLPMQDEVEVFFKKRLVRVIIPFIIWSIAYATLPVLWGDMNITQMKEHLLRLTFNFNLTSGHLWYIYMIIGIYLFMPVLSPWIKTVKKKHEEWFLILWFISTFYHYVKYLTGDEFGILGQCYWNEFYSLWYFSGYIGYVVLAHYIRTYINWSVKKSITIGLPMILIGWAITYISFAYFYPSGELYIIELGWRFCTPNTAMASFGLFIILKTIKTESKTILAAVNDISKLSYGMYLAHIFVLNASYKLLNGVIESIPVKIISIAVLTYILSYVLVKLLSYFPKSKYIVG